MIKELKQYKYTMRFLKSHGLYNIYVYYSLDNEFLKFSKILLYGPIKYGFSWTLTNEGLDFWHNVYTMYLKKMSESIWLTTHKHQLQSIDVVPVKKLCFTDTRGYYIE